MNLVAVIFVAAMAVHVVHAVISNRHADREADKRAPGTTLIALAAPFVLVLWSGVSRRARRVPLAAVLQSFLFVLACFFAARKGAFSRELVSPVSIVFGLMAGHLIFGLSLLITHRSFGDAARHFVDFGGLWEFVVEHPRVLMHFITVGIAEEVIYRAGAQPLIIQWTNSPLGAVLLVAVAFALVHEHFFKNVAPQSGEFVIFSLLLGVLYYWTGSLILVVVVHAVRNIEIAFLDYLLRVQDLGGEEQARRESEFLGGDLMLGMWVLPGTELHAECFEYPFDAVRRARGASPTQVTAPTVACRTRGNS